MHKTTVRELIEELQRQDPDAIVSTIDEYGKDMFVHGLVNRNEIDQKRLIEILFTHE